jgi:hypothetical protein
MAAMVSGSTAELLAIRPGDQSARAGDLNNDSIDDLVIGAPGADPNGQGSGAAYVIYGKSGNFPSVPESFERGERHGI